MAKTMRDNYVKFKTKFMVHFDLWCVWLLFEQVALDNLQEEMC